MGGPTGPVQNSRLEQNFYADNPYQGQVQQQPQPQPQPQPTQQQPVQQPQVSTTPFQGTGGFTNSYYGTTANPMTWMIQPGGKYVEGHGVFGGAEKTMAEISALQGASKAYVGMDLVDLGTAAQVYKPQPTPQELYAQQQSQPQAAMINGQSQYLPSFTSGVSAGALGSSVAYPGADAFAQDMGQGQFGDMQDEYFRQRQEVASILYPSQRGNGAVGVAPTSAQANLYGTIVGATNAAGNMINGAYGDAAFRNSLTSASQGSNMDVAQSNYQGTPFYQVNGGSTINIPANIQAELTKWGAYKDSLMNNTVGQYMTQFGAPPDMNIVNAFTNAVPQALQSQMQQYGLATLPAVANARAAINGWMDPVASAIASNSHVTSQAYNQSGAQFALPIGDQKGRLLRATPGAVADPALLGWADTADYISRLINPQGNWGQGISPGYNSMGMGAGGQFAVPDYEYQGDFQLHPEWGRTNSGLPSTMTPNLSTPRNNDGGQVNVSPYTSATTKGEIIYKPKYPTNIDGSPMQQGQYGQPPQPNYSPSQWAAPPDDNSAYAQWRTGMQPGNIMPLPEGQRATDFDGNPITATDQGAYLSWVNYYRSIGVPEATIRKMEYLQAPAYQPVVSGTPAGGPRSVYGNQYW